MIIGLGTAINVGGILLGGLAGLTCGRFLSERFQDTLMKACGVCVLLIGMGGALEKALVIDGSHLRFTGGLMASITLAVGSLAGELLNIQAGMERLGAWLKERFGKAEGGRFITAFVTASLTVCIGAMAIVGSIEDGIHGNYDVLALKAVLDAIIICIMTAAMGRGCLFSALPVAVFQGIVTLLAQQLGSSLTQPMLDNISYTGSLLIFCIGVNLVWDMQIRVSNMLPALVLAAAWAMFF